MINNIKLVSSFAHRDKSNIFSNVLVKDGMMMAQNDHCGICVAVDSDIDFACNAQRLSQTLLNCTTDKLKTKINKGKISVSSGRFRSSIDLINIDSYPSVEQSDNKFDIQADIIDQMNSLTQFSAPDDVRIALRGIAITNGYLLATNGHIAIKKVIDANNIDQVIVPTKSIQLFSRTGAIIRTISVTANMVFFNFDDGFLFSRIIDGKMPDFDRVITEVENPSDISAIKDDIKSLLPLCDGNIPTLLIGKTLETKSGNASIDGFNFNESAFNGEYLLKIAEVADVIDFTKYPKPCPFNGNGFIGAIAPMQI